MLQQRFTDFADTAEKIYDRLGNNGLTLLVD
jgi:hypothetical protein